MRSPILLVVVGPTAVGKTDVSIQLAQHFDAEIVSADARQFYQEMTIGTAKPTRKEREAVPHHLVDFLSVTEPYDVKQFEQDALDVLASIYQRLPVAIATGGSGLYVQTLVSGIDTMPEVLPATRSSLQKRWQQEGLTSLLDELERVDPDYFSIVDRQNHRRVIRALEVYQSTGLPYSSFRTQSTHVERPFNVITVGLNRPRDILYERVNRRVDQMIEQGLVDEARALYPWRNYQALRTVGYQEIFPMFDGQYDLAEAIRLIKRNTRRYAKRQLTWFGKDDTIEWFDMEEGQEAAVQSIVSYVQGHR